MSTYSREHLNEEGQAPLFALLIDAIENGRDVPYKDAAALLERHLRIPKVFSIHVGGVAGALMDTLLKDDKTLPLVNLLVVDSAKHVPGRGADGYLSKRYGSGAIKSPVGRSNLVAQEKAATLSYPRWRDLYAKHYGKPIRVQSQPSEQDGQGDNPKYAGGLPESEEHKNLKDYVLKHPQIADVPKRSAGKTEVGLPSGDRLDVFFYGSDFQAAVEVKSIRSNDDDLRRGIFQCVKYRAVMEAERQILGSTNKIHVRLVVERDLPHQLVTLARLLQVHWTKASVNKLK